MKKKNIKWIVLSIIAIAIVAVVLIKTTTSTNKELVMRTQVVENYTVENTVTATGTIEPVETVEIGTQVSGKIETIYVDYNSQVKKGELLAELDKQTLLERVSQAQANLTSAESQLKFAKLSYERTKQLYESNAATSAAFEEASNNYVQAQTNKENAQASYHQTKVDLGYAEIYSPIDGIVLAREVEEGQTVAASYSTPTLFTIANDLTKMQVEADVDEADIGQIKLNQHVTFSVDAYIDEVFDGTVTQIRLQPTTTNNVVTYTVIIGAPNPDLKLFPGMTASVTIVTEEATGLAVPAEALSFTPSENVLKMMRKTAGKPNEKPSQATPDANNDDKPIADMSTVWVKKGSSIMPKVVKIGMSDGAYKIVESGLQEGDSIVLSADYVAKKTKKNTTGSNPFMPQAPKRQ